MATTDALINYAYDEATALCKLITLLGPIPQEWMDTIGTEKPSWNFPNVLIEFTGALLSPRQHVTSLEQRVRSRPRVDTPELLALLREILVFEPSLRLGALEILDHPWLKSA